MDKILSLEFTYRDQTYFAFIRTKMNSHEKKHYVTIMNDELEQLFHGDHIVIENKGTLSSPEDILNEELQELKDCIVEALTDLLQKDYEKMN